LRTAREKGDADISRWAGAVDEAWLGEDLVWFSGAAGREIRAPSGFSSPISSTTRPTTRPGARDVDRRRATNQRHRFVPGAPGNDCVGVHHEGTKATKKRAL